MFPFVMNEIKLNNKQKQKQNIKLCLIGQYNFLKLDMTPNTFVV